MKRAFSIIGVLLAMSVGAQVSYFNQGFLRQPSAAADRAYLGITQSAITNGMNGIVYGDGVGFGVVTIGGGLLFAGGVLSAPGGAGTVTTFSAGNLSPLFTTAVATPNTTPALSFAQISQNANLFFASPNGAPGNPSFRAIVAADLPALPYVTSVGLALPVSVFSISGSPVTGAGTLTGSFQNQNANTIFAGPGSGVPAVPTFRLFLPADHGPFTNGSDVVPIALAPGDILAWSGAAWTNGPPGTGGATMALTNAGDPNGTLIYRSNAPTFQLKSITAGNGIAITNNDTNLVIAATATGGGGGSGGTGLTNFTTHYFDDSVYVFDEEFDSWRGTGSGLFSKNSGVAVTAVPGGGGGGIVNVASNMPPYYGLIEMQSSTTASNGLYVSQFSSTGIDPFQDLADATNWLFHSIFFLHTTNAGSVYRIGLADGINTTTVGAMFPSNSVGARWYMNLADGNHFFFEARSNATSVQVQSSVIVAIDTPYKFDMWCTNAGVVNFSINGETPLKLTNTPIQSVGIVAYDSTTNVGGAAQRMWLDRLSFMRTDMTR